MNVAKDLGDVDLYQVRLDVFEGPLDLLLHLIRTQEIDVYDIPISRITEQYLRFIQMMKDLSIDVAGEFLVMAATLIYIKSQMLLPRETGGEGEQLEDPRRELVEQLLEHEKFKNAAQMLYSRETVELSVWPRGVNEFEEEEQELVAAGVFDLIQAFHLMVQRFQEQIVLEVDHETVTVEDKLAEIRRLLTVHGEFFFSYFFERKISRRHLIVTLAALLEMVRLQEVRLFQTRNFEDIRIKAC